MEITKFVVERRVKIHIDSSYKQYQAEITSQIHTLRKKLEVTTKRRAKYSNKPITVEDISRNHEFVHLQLLMEMAYVHIRGNKLTSHTIFSAVVIGPRGVVRVGADMCNSKFSHINMNVLTYVRSYWYEC